MPETQTYTFQAEIRQLLNILSNSLYQNREITIRELISNASDALDKLRHIQLTDERYRDDIPLEIAIEPHKEDRVLVLRDNGIGMTHDELVSNLGTIAHSGSLEFLNRLSGDARKDVTLIGQFGVGFYSAFMLADKVEVVTRSFSEEKGWRWESEGAGSYSIDAAEDVPRGTQVRLHLKPDLDEFLEPDRLKGVVRKYSAFVPHPIRLRAEILNDQKPIWVEPRSNLDEEKYIGFYQHLTHRADEKPLWHLHVSSDSPLQFHALLYCPKENFELLGFGKIEHGLHLCAKRILVQDNNRDLLPEYLRFIHGLVDSADLPLSVSRETLQDNTLFRKLRRVLAKKVLDQLDTLAADRPDEYLTFYRQFGPNLREGLATDFENRDRIARLLRFPSSHGDSEDALTSLDDYVKRCPESQKQIYFVAGPDQQAILKNPNLEIFHRKKLEVLYLVDPIDEIALQHLHEFSGKRIVPVDAADVELPEGEEPPPDEPRAELPEAAPLASFEALLRLFRDSLGDQVSSVRESKRLTDSPCCLVNAAGSASTQVQKLMRMSHQDFPASKRALEVNRSHPLIRRLANLSGNDQHHDFVRECGRQLFTNAMILEGLSPDAEAMTRRVQQFMADLAQHRSPIIT